MDRPTLALYGGTPVRTTPLPYGHQLINEEDLQAVAEVLRGDWLTQGPHIDEFEEAFAEFIGTRYAVAFNSGTAALHAACLAAGLGSGDEAIVPAITFAATSNAALYVGAHPVFADVEPDSGLLNVEDLRRCVNGDTRAILPVHYAGLPVDMDPLLELARENGLTVIEDACHAPGAVYRDRRIGTLGDLACFSFHPVKHFTTGEGGMVTTDRADWADRMRAFRTHGIVKPPARMEALGGWHYEMVELGFNYRLTDIQAALGLSQLRHADDFLRRRGELAAFYDAAFRDIDGVSFLQPGPERTCVYHLYPLLVEMDALSCDKKTLFAALRAEGIGVQVHYIPVPDHPYYRTLGYSSDDLPGARRFFSREISLPMSANISAQDREDVVAAVNKVLAAFRR